MNHLRAQWREVVAARKPLYRGINMSMYASEWDGLAKLLLQSGDESVVKWVAAFITRDRGAGMHWSDRDNEPGWTPETGSLPTSARTFMSVWEHYERDGDQRVRVPTLLVAFHDPADVFDNTNGEKPFGRTDVFHRSVEGEHPVMPGGRLWLSEVELHIPGRSWLQANTPIPQLQEFKQLPGEDEMDFWLRKRKNEENNPEVRIERRTFKVRRPIEMRG